MGSEDGLPTTWIGLIAYVVAGLIGAGGLKLLQQMAAARQKRLDRLYEQTEQFPEFLQSLVKKLEQKVSELEKENRRQAAEIMRLTQEHRHCQSELKRLQSEIDTIRRQIGGGNAAAS